MECNKDEAVRARHIAERKFAEGDYVGAKKFALKAQNLYPELEGLSQMLTIFDVYISAQTRSSSGEVDWYSVLGVNRWTDEETIRKQYHMLALTLHPDKNKSPGANGAFKLVSEAWSLLSDKARRLAYNEKLNVSQHRVSTEARVSSQRPGDNGFHDGNSKLNSSRSQNQKNQTRTNSVPSSHQKSGTFWTICNRCKTQYEYLRVYLNHTLLCPNCQEAFVAMEKPPPPNVVKPSNYSSQSKYQNSGFSSANSNSFNNNTDLKWKDFSRMAVARGTSSSSTVQSASLVHPAGELVKKRKSAQSKITNEFNAHCYGSDVLNKMVTGNGTGIGNLSEPKKGYVETDRIYGFSGNNSRSITNRESTFVDVRNVLMRKAWMNVHGRLEEWSTHQMKQKGNKKQKIMNTEVNDHLKYNESAVMNGGKQKKKSFPVLPSDDTDNVVRAAVSINVPDPDFHNFDLDRTESSFGDNQLWAAYDENDGMPRYYARIQKVISLKPFKMKISWLNSRSNSEFSSIDWVGSGFTKTCGDFRTGRHEIAQTLNYFSHKVKWIKGARGIIRILPNKGDVWALYRNWSPDWNVDTPNETVHKYVMVEVLDDYDEEHGISVIPLVKVMGFKTVFQKHMDPKEVKRIPKEEMFRFSHQVPDHLLTGEEAHNAPKGCRELDPAAIPLDLLQINEKQTTEAGEKAEVPVQNEQTINIDEIMEDASRAEEVRW